MFFHERGEIRDGSFESQTYRASALNLVVSAIILWNTVYLSRVVDHLLADGHDLPEELLRHVSPQIWEHINLIGTYVNWVGTDLRLPVALAVILGVLLIRPAGLFGRPRETRA